MTNYEDILQKDLAGELEGLLTERDEKTKKKTKRAKKGEDVKSVKKLTKKEQQIIDLANQTVLPDNYFLLWTEQELREAVSWLGKQSVVALDTETMGVNWTTDEIVGISFYAPDRGYYIPLKHRDEDIHCLPKQLVIDILRPLFEEKDIKWLLHNYKFDAHIMRQWMGIKFNAYFDTMIAAALLDENQSKALKDLAPHYLKIEADKFSTLFGNVTFDKIPIKLNEDRTGCLSGYYAIKDTELTYKLAQFFARALNYPGLERINHLFYQVEMPFLHIVVDAEARGVKLDTDYLENTVAKQLNEEVESLRQRIWSYLGEINLNSPIQLSEALYVKLALPRVNQKKPDSTDKNTLKKLRSYHEVIPLLIDYRGKTKLQTAFADKLPKAAVKGRIHTSFNSIGAKTGRMSSRTPNLQQVPARIGNLIRNAFVSDEGRLLASIDFSGQELRVLAHVSQDKILLDIFRNGGDVHSMTGTGMYNRIVKKEIEQLQARLYDLMNGKDAFNTATMRKELEAKIAELQGTEVTYEFFQYCREMTGEFQDSDGNFVAERFTDYGLLNDLHKKGIINTLDEAEIRKQAKLGVTFEKTRKAAKTVNFGIVYGMSEQGLAETLEISEEEARTFIDGYFDAYPGVKRWMAEQRKLIKKQKYTETMLGRKRRVHNEMESGKFWLEQKAYRMGINSIIQGSSSDMVKIASIKLQPLLEELGAYIVLWVHDEIIFSVPESVGMENLQRIADVMCNALPVDCGLKSDIEVGTKWGQKLSKDEMDLLADLDDVA